MYFSFGNFDLLMIGIYSDDFGILPDMDSWNTVNERNTVMPREIFSSASAGNRNTSGDKSDSSTHGVINVVTKYSGFRRM
jgi:hypothetical protein